MNVRRSFEMEITETESWKEIIGVDIRQDETRLSEIRPSQAALVSQRELEDDWFVKPVVMPPGTFNCLCDFFT